MTIFFALIALGAVVAAALRLRHTIGLDGYGQRPPPRSHYLFGDPVSRR